MKPVLDAILNTPMVDSTFCTQEIISAIINQGNDLATCTQK